MALRTWIGLVFGPSRRSASLRPRRERADWYVPLEISRLEERRVLNVAPILNGANAAVTVHQNQPDSTITPTTNATKVFDLINNPGQVTDPDSGALQGIAVTAVDNSHGNWQYTTDNGGSWHDFGSPSESSARLLRADASTYVRFIPATDFHGTVSQGITFRAWDQTSGSAGDTADTSGSNNGGTTAFSTATASSAITVDQPITISGTHTTPLNDNQTANPFSGVTIADSISAAENINVTVTQSEAGNGSLSNLNGFIDNGNGTFSFTGTAAAATTALQGLVFTPTAHQVTPGNSIDTHFTILAADSVTSTTDANTVTHVTAFNNPPTINGAVANQAVNDNATIAPFAGVTISDPDVSSEPASVTVTLDHAANGQFTAGSTVGWTVNVGAGTYTFSGTRAEVQAALQGLVFAPTNHQVVPGGTVTTQFTIDLTDGPNLASDSNTTVVATAINNPPTINGTVADQAVNDNATIQPFSGVTISDPDNSAEPVTLTVTLDHPADGQFTAASTVGWTVNVAAGTYTFSGTRDQAQTALQGLVFAPANHQVVPGATVTTQFTIQLTDGPNSANDNNTTVIATAINNPPTILGTQANQAVNDNATIQPFSGVTISDPDNSAEPATITISLDHPEDGRFSAASTSAAGWTVVNVGGGIYTFTGTRSQAQAALQGLVFVPTNHQVIPGQTVTTQFTIQLTDGANSASDNTTTVVATAINNPPTILGTQANQPVSDNATIQPFSGVTISDPDNSAEPATITVTLDNAANGQFTAASTVGWTVNVGAGTYSLSGTRAQVQAALQGLVFSPTNHQVAPGATVTTHFTIDLNDGGNLTSDANTSVIATAFNNPPTILGTQANQAVNDNATISPFSGVTISDPDVSSEPVSVTVSLDHPANGQFTAASTAGWTVNVAAGTYTFNGTRAAVETSLQALVFAPTNHQVVPGATVTTQFTIQLTDGPNSASDNKTTVIATAINNPPTIVGTTANQPVNDNATIQPFAGVTISDPDNPNEPATITITLDHPENGQFSAASTAAAGWTTVNVAGGIYTFTGTRAAAQAALQGLVFVPTNHQVIPGQTVTTQFSIQLTDGADSASDNTTTVIATAINNPPTILGTQANQPVNDNATIQPFAGVTISDPDQSAEPASVTVTIDNTANGQFTAASTAGWTVNLAAGTYSISGTRAQVEAALKALVFAPTAHQVNPGSTVTTHFTIDLNDGGNLAHDATTSVVATAINNPPTILGTTANQAVNDNATIQPFSGVTISDPDISTEPATITVTLDHAGNGQFSAASTVGWTVNVVAGTYTFTGTRAQAQTALQGLVFVPTNHQVIPGQTVTTQFTIQLTDGPNSASDNTTTVIATAINNPPTILGTQANQAVNDNATIQPFAGVTISDPDNPNEPATITITLDHPANGQFSAASTSAAGWTTVNVAGGIYTFTGTRAQAQAALQGLVFVPTNHQVIPGQTVTTQFSIQLTDGANSASDNATTVIATAVNNPPTILGTQANQPVNDNATIQPFAGVTISDPDDPDEPATITVTLDHAANGQFSAASTVGWTVNVAAGTYTFSGTRAQAQAALQGLVFVPTNHQVIPGQTVTTRFTIQLTDGANSASDNATTVIATAINNPPTILGTQANQAVNDNATIQPFAGVTISDADNPDEPATITVTLDHAGNGQFSAASTVGWTVNIAAGTYTFTGTRAQAQTALQGLVFVPTNHQVIPGQTVTTQFTIQLTDGANSASDNKTTVVATAINNPPAIVGTTANQPVNDNATIQPFAGVTISDPDNPNEPATITVSLDHPANGRFSAASTAAAGWTTVNVAGGIYTFTGTRAQAQAALQGLVFVPTNHQVIPGQTVTTQFSIQLTDGANSASDNKTTVVATAINNPPTILGTTANQQVNDNATIQPFTGVTISDPDDPDEPATITVTLDHAANGQFSAASTVGWTVDVAAGTYTFSGTRAQAQAALQALVFVPTNHQVIPGQTVTTQFTIQLTDGANSASDNKTTVVATAINNPPAILGTTANQPVNDNATIQPFAGVTFSDPDNPNEPATITITLDHPENGRFSAPSTAAAGWTTVNVAGGTYTFTGTRAQAQAALQGLVFVPTNHQVIPGQTVTTQFTIQLTDGANSASDNATTVVATAINNPPTILGTQANQPVNDNATIQPFAGVTISDPDKPDEPATITITMDHPANGQFTAASTSDAGWTTVNVAGGIYTFTGTRAQAQAALQALVFTPTAHQVVPGATVTTQFTIQLTDGANSASDNKTTVIATAINNPPTILGTLANQAVNDDATIQLFSGVTISDPDNPDEPATITVTLDHAANGQFSAASTVGWTVNVAAGTYTFSGTRAQAQAALQALVFVPTNHQVIPGQTVATQFTIQLTDGANSASDNKTTVIATAINNPPAIVGTTANQPVNDDATIQPFAGVTISDPDNPNEPATITITLDHAENGQFSAASTSAAGWTTVNVAGGIYTFTGTRAQAQAALQGLVFVPTNHQVIPDQTVTTQFTIQLTDGANSASDNKTTVIATAINNPPTILGTLANQAVNDDATIQPFAGVSISDPDNPDEPATITVTLDHAGNGQFSAASTVGWTVDVAAGTYTFTGTRSQAQAALQGLVFVPTNHQVIPGQTVTTQFTIQLTDGINSTGDNKTTVIATAINNPPAIVGTTAGQPVNDNAVIQPFAGVTISDPDNPDEPATITVTLDHAVNGQFSAASTVGWTVDVAAGTYTFSGTRAQAQAALQALVFVPTNHQVIPGQTVTTQFTIQLTDGANSASDNATTVVATAINNPPALGGTLGNQPVNEDNTIQPFSGVTNSDPDNPNEPTTITVTLDHAGDGKFTAASTADPGWTTVDVAGGTYTFTGTRTAALAALRALVYSPTPGLVTVGHTVTTTFTIQLTDGGLSTSDSTTTVAPWVIDASATQIDNAFKTTLTIDVLGANTGQRFDALIDWGGGDAPTTISLTDGSNLIADVPRDLTQRYLTNPNQQNASAPIPIKMTVAAVDASGHQIGDSATATTEAKVPGAGLFAVKIVSTSGGGFVNVTLPTVIEAPNQATNQETTITQSNDGGAASSESANTDERLIFLRIVSPSDAEAKEAVLGDVDLSKVPKLLVGTDGKLPSAYQLRDVDLNDLPSLFKKLPDGRYQIYLQEEGHLRLVIDVAVRQGRAVDPSGDSGGRDRPPTGQIEGGNRDPLAEIKAQFQRAVNALKADSPEVPQTESPLSPDAPKSLLPAGAVQSTASAARVHGPAIRPSSPADGRASTNHTSATSSDTNRSTAAAAAAVGAAAVGAGAVLSRAERIDRAMQQLDPRSLSKAARLVRWLNKPK